MQITTSSLRQRIGAAVVGIILMAGASACTAESSDAADNADITTEIDSDAGTEPSVSIETDSIELASVEPGAVDVELFDSSVVHDIQIEFDQGAYDAMIETYETDGDKDWIEATVTIDGTTFETVGLRLKGNSSLFGLTSDTAENPEELPWLIRFDKFVDDQTHQGHADLVIRSNSTETAMNEAVALELLGLAGLATEEAMATTFTVNGGATELRLVIEHPDELWEGENFDSDESALYKADSEGDYSYRGDDPDAYDDVFDQKVGDDDLEPLIDFLEFINNTDDATFTTELGEHLDLEAFATYLAFQDLVDNFDDIDGRGNNSYLHFDYDTEQFTVVNWDLNLAFGTANVTGGGAGAGGGPSAGGERPEAPEGLEPPAGGRGGAGGPGGAGATSNVLVERFLEVDEFAAMYIAATAELTDTLYTSGAAQEIIDEWVAALSAGAADVVDVATVQSDADAISASIAGV